MPRNPLTRLDDFVVERVAQPIVDRFPGVPLREQVRFCVMGTFAAWGGRLTHLHTIGQLDGGTIVLGAGMLAALCASYAVAGGVPRAGRARNPNRINPIERTCRVGMLAFTASTTLGIAVVMFFEGWSGVSGWATACNAAYTATLYAAACDNPPPPAPKAAVAPAGAGI